AAPARRRVGGLPARVLEGFRLRPTRLFRRGEPIREIFGLIEANVRVPEAVLGDIRAQRAALHVGATKLAELHERRGSDVLEAAADEILALSEHAVRRELSRMPEGTVSFVDHVDDF